MLKTERLAAIALAFALSCRGTLAQTPIPPSPPNFVMTAAQSDQYEILAAQAATVQALDPRVQAFAQRMIQDHTRLTDDLRQAAVAAGLPSPKSGLSSDQAALLSSLQSLRGAEFDKTYARQQVLAHTQAVVVHESFADAGADPSLRKAAGAALPTLKDHLMMAQQLRADVGGS